MPEFLESAGEKLAGRFPGSRIVAFGHLGDGNVHLNVQAPAGEDGARWLAEQGDEVSAFVHDLVAGRGGSISAEHGIGQMKPLELARTLPPARLAVLRALKRTLDPAGIMNRASSCRRIDVAVSAPRAAAMFTPPCGTCSSRTRWNLYRPRQ